jgi:hypothetical protein
VSFLPSSYVVLINPSNITERMEVEQMIVSSGEVRWAAAPYILEV